MRDFIEDLKTKVFCRLGVSKIHGVGVIAIRDIPKGINPMQEQNPQEFEEVDNNDLCKGLAGQPAEIKRLVIDMCPEVKELPLQHFWNCPKNGFNSIGVAWYLNHSDNPNMEERDGDFYSICPINAGEELTVDYGTYGKLNL
jgi:hypothetical protein